jgi:glycosyltransferase involved in cell wall biosynthesis
MKKIVIVNNNMKVGGVQKSLCNLLWELDQNKDLDVTLVLFSSVGDYMDRIPPGVKCIETKSLFRYLGVSQGEMRGIDRFKRGFLAAVCRTFGRSAAMKFILPTQKTLPENYDYAIAFLHNGRQKTFFGGVQDFVMHKVNAAKKITFLHDDYEKCGADHKRNNDMMARFDMIAACSDGCRGVFEAAQPQLAYKSTTVRNCNNIEEIRSMADEDTVEYDKDFINVLCAARLSPRKGIDRAIEAASFSIEKGVPIKLHILGSGVMAEQLRQMVTERGLGEHVTFYGEQSNPYRFMKNADLFLLTSYHEAAPMVIDEAYILGVPTLTTRTNSSDEMVTARNCGWVCENDQDSLNRQLYDVISDRSLLYNKKENLKTRVADNSLAMAQFYNLIK